MTPSSPPETLPTHFEGFTSLDANFLYCPNQFFDVCLPHSSRSVVRLVAYLLDQTLGWLDQNGNPVTQHITVSYRQLIVTAGISRGGVRRALGEALAAGFIRCVREGRPAAAGESPEQAMYALRWDERDVYQDSFENFQGFYAGEGHRTPIPNAFFRSVIPCEPLTVTKVVGAVLRHTVGYQNQFGGRRSQAPLAYRYLQAYANIGDPTSLSEAISSAIHSKYIVCVEEGRFHSDPNLRKPATYAIRWLGDRESSDSGSKSPAGEQFKNPSSLAVQKPQQHRFEIPSRSGPKNPAAEQFKNPSKEITTVKHTLKQQQTAVAATLKRIQRLRDAGFDAVAAARLSSVATDEQIAQQIAWLPQRNPDHNRLGMLRRAIEENWAKPEGLPDLQETLRQRRERDRARMIADRQEDEKISAAKEVRLRWFAELKQVWVGLSDEEQRRIESAAYDRQEGAMLKKFFRTMDSHRLRECLWELDRRLNSQKTPHSSS